MFYLAHVTKQSPSVKKGGVYFVNEANAKIFSRVAKIYPFELIEKYSNQPELLIVRTGGIGDLIALSILGGVAPKVTVLTQKKHLHLFDWWQIKPTAKHFNEPLFVVKNEKELIGRCSKIGTMIGEDLIEQGGNQNWYEVFCKSVGRGLISGRPLLKSVEKCQIPGCLVVSEASSINRTADPEMLKRIANKFFENVYMANEQHLTTDEYIDVLSKIEFVISVDTSAIHFREGIGLPAFGIYGAFTTESRTKYYTQTKSIDVANSCPISPCFTHLYSPCKHNGGFPFAPCLSNENQMELELKNYLETL